MFALLACLHREVAGYDTKSRINLGLQIFDSPPSHHTQTSPGVDAVTKPVLYVNAVLGWRGRL